jgi:hypothetical protein
VLADAREAIALEPSGGNASTSVWQGVQAAARLRDAAAVTELLGSTAGLRGEWIDWVRAAADAVVTGLGGDPSAAALELGRVLEHWRRRDLPLDHACTAALALHLLPAELVPDDDVDAARAYLRGLDAHGLLRLF